jgi:hypothetical protein
VYGSLALHGGDDLMQRMQFMFMPDQTIPAAQLASFMDDVGLELVNQVCGRLKHLLAEQGAAICLGLPELCRESGPIRHKVPGHVVAIPLAAGGARIVVELCLGDPSLAGAEEPAFEVFLTG